MKTTKFTESQIIAAIKENQEGKSVFDICRLLGNKPSNIYSWKAKHTGMDGKQLKRVKELESELAQYKKIVAEQALNITIFFQKSQICNLHYIP